MTKNKLRITIAILSSLAIVAAMASCGRVETPDTDLKQPDSVLTDSNNIQTDNTQDILPTPDVTSQAVTEPIVTTPPQTDEYEPEITEPDTTPDTADESTLPIDPVVNVTEPYVTEPEPDENSSDKASYAESIVNIAQEQLGVPYKSGGDSPEKGFDSSGFTYYCVNQAGMKFPRNIKAQLEAYSHVSYSELKAGDIVYFSAEPDEKASFCGVYVGGGLIIYSPVPDEFVKTANITTNYWTSRFVTGLRIE